MPDRWTLGIISGFLVVFLANGLLVWFALDQPLELDPTYTDSR